MESSYTIDQMNEYKKKLIKLVLNNASSKLPIKRSEMVSQAVNGNNKLFPQVLTTTKEFLAEVYGFNLVEVPETKSSKIFIVVSVISSASNSEFTQKQTSELVLLFLVLSYIFMKGEPVNEDAVFNYLTKLQIPLDEPHEFFDLNVKKTITDSFVKQLYLKREKMQTVTSAETEFLLSWGFRATLEFSKKEILGEVAKILGKPTICFVRQQLEISKLHGEDMEVDQD